MTRFFEVIPNGIPDVAFDAADAARTSLDLTAVRYPDFRPAVSPTNGIEVMIGAMPSILKTPCGNALCRASARPIPIWFEEQGRGLIARA